MTDEQVAALNAALAMAQGEFPPIPRDKTVTVKTRSGDRYTFSYAPLDSILGACRPVLAKHGLAVTQQLEQHDGVPAIRTELRHAAGGVIGSSFPLSHTPESPQQLGSLLTYLRRYAIVALLGVAAEEDDDARSVESAKKKPAAKSTTAQRRTIYTLRSQMLESGVTVEAFEGQLQRDYGTSSVSSLTKTQASALIDRLEKKLQATKSEGQPEANGDQDWEGYGEDLVPEDIPFE